MSDLRLPAKDVDILLAAAVAAPSMYNTQPWRFEVQDHVIDVILDDSRTLPAEDPTGRAMRIAAGAATVNLRCAAESLGYGTWLGLAPYPEEPGLLARIVVEPTSTPDEDLRSLAEQIPKRHTDRHPSDAGPLREHTRIALIQAAYAEGAELTWLDEPEVHAVLDMLLDTDLREIYDWRRRSPVRRSDRGRAPTRQPSAIWQPGRSTGCAGRRRSRPIRISPYCPPNGTSPPIRSRQVSPSNACC